MKNRIIAMFIAVAVIFTVLPMAEVTVAQTPIEIVVGHTNGIVHASHVNDALATAGLTRDSDIPFTVTFEEGVTSIWWQAFENCTALTSIILPNSLTTIAGAFIGCASLTEITIPDSVTSISDWTFAECTSLTNINVSSNNTNFSSVNGILFNKDKTTLLRYPSAKTETSYIIPNGVESISNDAFESAISLTEITIPDSVTSIGETAFYYCTSLTSITIPNGITSIERFAFWCCTSLTEVTIPDSVTSIGEEAFAGCSSLTEVIIPNGVKTIGRLAFGWCSSLTEVTIPDSVTQIGSNAFVWCTDLMSINVTANNSNYSSQDGVLFNKEKTFLVQCPGGKSRAYAIPNSVTEIRREAFNGCTSLTGITIPDSVKTIGVATFANCQKLETITFKGTTPPTFTLDTFWGISAVFENCTALTTIYVLVGAKSAYQAEPQLSEYNIVEIGGDRVNFNTDRWKFENQTTKIDYNFYTRAFGIVQGSVLYSRTNNGTGGQCYGMVAATAAINDKSPNVTSFGRDLLIDVQDPVNEGDDFSSEIGMTAADFIKYGYLLQFYSEMQKQKSDTTNNLQGLYTAIKRFQDGNGEPIIIDVRGDTDTNTNSGHAIYPLRIIRETDKLCEILIYDPNFHPYFEGEQFRNECVERTLTLFKNNEGIFTRWEYPFQYDVIGYDGNLFAEGITWGSEHSNGAIMYTMPTSILYEMGLIYNQRNRNTNNSLLQNNDLLLSASINSFTIQADNSNNPDWLIPIKSTGGIDETNGLYWVDTNEPITISNIEEPLNFSLMGYERGIEVEVPTDTVISVSASEDNGEFVNLNMSKDSYFTIKYLTGNGEFLDNISISAKSNSTVKTERIENEIFFTGINNVSITAEVEDKSVTVSFPDISDEDKHKVVILETDNEIEIVLEDVTETPIIFNIDVVEVNENFVIEIQNATNETISTKGLFLTDEEENLHKWQMPSFIIKPNETILIKGSEDNVTSVLKRGQVNFDNALVKKIYLTNAKGDILAEWSG